MKKYKDDYNAKGVISLEQILFVYFMNNINLSYPIWTHPKIANYYDFTHSLDNIYVGYMPYTSEDPPNTTCYGTYNTTPHKVRQYGGERGMGAHYLETIKNAGWHWNFLMSDEKMALKLKSYAHQENNTSGYTGLDHHIQERKKAPEPNSGYWQIEIDERFPDYLRDNIDKYRDWILPARSEPMPPISQNRSFLIYIRELIKWRLRRCPFIHRTLWRIAQFLKR